MPHQRVNLLHIVPRTVGERASVGETLGSYDWGLSRVELGVCIRVAYQLRLEFLQLQFSRSFHYSDPFCA